MTLRLLRLPAGLFLRRQRNGPTAGDFSRAPRRARRESAAMCLRIPVSPQVGRERAEALARLLKDAQITAIYTTEYKRTRKRPRRSRSR